MDKILNLIEKNESKTYDYHCKKLETSKEIEIAKINAGIVGEKTHRLIALSLMIVLPVITCLILFFKETFFVPWLTFLTGSIGGFGIGKTFGQKTAKEESRTTIDEEE